MKANELKEILIKNKYNINKTAAELDIDVDDLKELIKEYNLLEEKKENAQQTQKDNGPTEPTKKSTSFKQEILDNMEKFINDKFLVAKIMKNNILKKVEEKKIEVTDPQFMAVMKYVDDIIKECFQLSEKYKINSKNKIM